MKKKMSLGAIGTSLSRNEMKKIMAGSGEALAECQRIAQLCYGYSNTFLQGKANGTCTKQFDSCARTALGYF